MITALHRASSVQYDYLHDLSHANTMALACVADTVVTLADEAQLDSFMASM